MTHYGALIRSIAPGRDPRLVEAFMRLDHGTLDHLSRSQFRAEAEIAADCVAADPGLAESLAQSFGL